MNADRNIKVKATKYEYQTNGKVTVYKVGEITVAEHKAYGEYFCSYRNGRYSNLRDQYKRCGSFNWNHSGLAQVYGVQRVSMGTRSRKGLFTDTYPDTRWGSTGIVSAPSAKYVMEQILERWDDAIAEDSARIADTNN